MRFPRQTKIFRGQLDVAPFAGVFFLLIIFVLLQSSMVFPPGVPIELPQSGNLPGTDDPTVVVAVDATGQLYFDNQIVTSESLETGLRRSVNRASGNLTLILKADKEVSYGRMIEISLIAESAGISQVLLATRHTTTPIPVASSDAR